MRPLLARVLAALGFRVLAALGFRVLAALGARVLAERGSRVLAELGSRVLAELGDAVWPPRCRLCGREAPDAFACAAHALAPPPGPRCGRCGARLPPPIPGGALCAGCRRAPPPFRSLVALAGYRGAGGAREWVLALKHGGRAELARPLGRALGRALGSPLVRGVDPGLGAGAPPALLRAGRRGGARPPRRSARGGPGAAPLLVPVPLHPLRRLERGSDQALALARAAGEAAGLPVLGALRRVRPTAPQGAPGAVSRAANVRGAFAVRRRARARLAGRTLWLVDDVVTSGATAAECARVLRRAGAAAVHVLCVARAGDDEDP